MTADLKLTPADFIQIGFRYPAAAAPVAVEAGFKVVGLTHHDPKHGQVYKFHTIAEFNEHRRAVMESVGRHGVNIPVPVVEILQKLDDETFVLCAEALVWLKGAIRLGAEFQNSGLNVEVHGQFGQIGIAMQDRERGVPIMWFRDVDHFNSNASDIWEVRRGINEVPIPVVEIPAEWPDGMEPRRGDAVYVEHAWPKPLVPTPGIPAFPEGGIKAEPESVPSVDITDTDQPQDSTNPVELTEAEYLPAETVEAASKALKEVESKDESSDLAKSVVEYVQNATEKVRITAIARDLGVEKDAIKAILELKDSPIKQNAAGVITLNR